MQHLTHPTPFKIDHSANTFTFVDLSAAIGLLGINVVADRLFFSMPRLPEDAYFEPVLVTQLCSTGWPRFVMLVVCFLGGISLHKLRWHDLPSGTALRVLVVSAAFTLTWAFSTNSYNCYFAQTHAFDRMLLAALWIVVAFRPGWTPLLLLQSMLMIWQLDYPLGGFSWTDKSVRRQLASRFSDN